MSEEEIIKYIKDEIENDVDTFHWFDDNPNNKTRKDIEKGIEAHQGLLDLYNKEKEKNKELKEDYDIIANDYNYFFAYVRNILGLEDEIDLSTQKILKYLQIIVDENNRLEDI